MTEDERHAWVISRRKEVETELREAEILLGILKKHLTRVDALLTTMELDSPVKARRGKRKTRHRS